MSDLQDAIKEWEDSVPRRLLMDSDSRNTCPNREAHTQSPKGYLQWHGWAVAKVKTHKQVRCEGCNHFSIWVPKEAPDGQ